MTPAKLAACFELAKPPEGFIDDPYPVYALLREFNRFACWPMALFF